PSVDAFPTRRSSDLNIGPSVRPKKPTSQGEAKRTPSSASRRRRVTIACLRTGMGDRRGGSGGRRSRKVLRRRLLDPLLTHVTPKDRKSTRLNSSHRT